MPTDFMIQQLDDDGPYAGEGEIAYFERLARQAAEPPPPGSPPRDLRAHPAARRS